MMRKARSSKEKNQEPGPTVSPEDFEDEERPRRRRVKSVSRADEDRSGRRRPRAEENGEEEAARPILTAIPRPGGDGADPRTAKAVEEPAAAVQSVASPEVSKLSLESPRTGEPMQVIKLMDLKRMKITELSKMAHDLNIEGAQGLKKQDLIFAILSGIADKRFEVHAEGVLELLSDGFGFLRSADSDYQPSPDDIYVSPSQVRRFNLRPGDTVTGPIRQPREGERFFALQKVDKVNFVDPVEAKERILFDNLTPLYPTRKLKLEHDGSELTTRVI